MGSRVVSDDAGSKKTLSLSEVKNITKKEKVPSLLQLAKKDSELRDFLRLVSQWNFRHKAIEALKERIEKI